LDSHGYYAIPLAQGAPAGAQRGTAAGKMLAQPKILRVLRNGQPAATNPIMLQGDHGSVAYRNILIRPLDGTP